MPVIRQPDRSPTVRRRSLAPVFALLSLLLFAALMVLVSSQHRLRLIIGSYEIVDSSADIAPSDSFRYMADPQNNSASQFSIAITILQQFDSTHPMLPGDALPAIDQPDTCQRLLEEGRRVHCYNADIGVCALLAKKNILARLWDINGAFELGGIGHNLLEVFDAPTGKWIALDPYYHCYFTLGSDSIAIGVPALRTALMNDPMSVHLVRYSTNAEQRPDADIRSELILLVPGAMLHSNNDFRWRYAHRYGWLMPIASIFDRFPLRASRGIRMLMLGSDDTHYIVEDTHSPHYPFTAMKWVFWSLFVLFVLFLVLTIIEFRSKRRTGSI
jgi:hypothetical protein